MSTLTYSHDAAGAIAERPAAERVEAPRKSFWRRVLDAIVTAQQRRAEREIAAYLATRGVLFTDDTEREMMQRLSGGGRRSV